MCSLLRMYSRSLPRGYMMNRRKTMCMSSTQTRWGHMGGIRKMFRSLTNMTESVLLVRETVQAGRIMSRVPMRMSVQGKARASIQTKMRIPVQSGVRAAIETWMRMPAQSRARASIQTKMRMSAQSRGQAPIQTKTRMPAQSRVRAAIQTGMRMPVQSRGQAPIQTKTRMPAQSRDQIMTQTEVTICRGIIFAIRLLHLRTEPENMIFSFRRITLCGSVRTVRVLYRSCMSE